MSRDPAFLFYPNDYLGGTMGFTFEEHGMYLMLLIYQFNQKDFDYETAQNICSNKFDSIKNKFTFDENSKTYFNPRLKEEIEKREKFSQSRRNNINMRYKKATSVVEVNPLCSTSVLHMENKNEIRNEDVNESGIEKEIVKRKQFEVPAVQEIAEYCKERKNNIDAQSFFDHYEARDWKPKGYTVRMKDWKAAIRTWEKNNYNSSKPQQKKMGFEKNIDGKYSNLKTEEYNNDF